MAYEEIYTKPNSGIPEEHLSQLVQDKLLPHEFLTQAEYDAKLNADLIEDDVFYIITDETGSGSVPFAGKIELVLRADAWNGSSAPYTQNLTVANLKASSAGEFGLSNKATFAEREAARNASIMITAQRDGGITVSADSAKPTIDIPCVLTVFLKPSSDDSFVTTEYDNSKSGLDATTYQEAIDELADYHNKVLYTVRIDLNNSNPETCCTYMDDAVGMAKGAVAWDNQSIFKSIKPCVFRDGQVNYYLDKNDWNKKVDGTPSNLTGADGDYMVEFPKFAHRIYKDGNYLYVSITNDPNQVAYDSRFHYYAFSRNTEGDREHFYLGGFKGSLNSAGNLQSVSGVAPANYKTIAQFKELANNRGDGYTINSYNQVVALQCLYLIKYGNLDGQSALGRGVSDTSAAINTGGSASSNRMYYGNPTSGSNVHMKFAGIEDFWGNIWEWIDGLTTDGSWNIITNKTINGNAATTPSGLTGNAGGWVKDVSGTTETGFMPTGFGGSSTTYFCDHGDLYSGCVLVFGGAWSDGDGVGPFCLNATDPASASGSNVGARLLYV